MSLRRVGHADPARVLHQGATSWRDHLVGLSRDKKSHTFGRVGCAVTAVAQAVLLLRQELATPLTVQSRGIAASPPVWTQDRPASARLGRLVRAQGLRCDDAPIGDDGDEVYTDLDTASHRRAILDTLAAGGACLLWVDTDLSDASTAGRHWVLAHAALVDDSANGIVGVVHICDPATARVEGLDLRTLSGCIMWGERPRAYAVRAVRPILR